jgi:phosphoribosylamine--glycine ligase/phosphoribosylaminoimidazole synthetase
MNVLVIGAGGREHAIVWKISQSPKLTKLYALPGNPGTSNLAQNVSEVAVDDHAAVAAFCKDKHIDLVIVGPEAPLAAGLVDALSSEGVRCFGPRQAAAQIEASKVFAKDFMARHNIPTARYATFSNFDEAVQYLESVDYPIVVKASGLAAGKGVILPETMDEARSTLKSILLDKTFGDAGDEVVIEERLNGPEVSLMAFTDGTSVVPMLPAQDHKRLLDGDEGPNTGGMGAYAPAPIFSAEMMTEAIETVLKPAVNGLRHERTPFVGVLYAGLMLTSSGIRVLEFNCRFGDPETQVVLPLLETDLLEVADACVDGRLSDVDVRWKHGAAVCVVLASKGYPDNVESGKWVTIGELPEDVVCFHAGTKTESGKLITSGGRVLGLTAWAKDLNAAVRKAYAEVTQVSFEDMQYRQDIAYHALFPSSKTDGETSKQISDGRSEYRTAKLVHLPTDQLTYTVNGLAMQVHNELGAGHAEKFYQRRLADLCHTAGIPVEMEKRVEVWVSDTLIGYLKLDLWIDERLVVECKSFSHSLGVDDVGQVLTYLAATASPIGMLYNFGRRKLEFKRILQPKDVQDWQKHLYRFMHRSSSMVLPPLGGKRTSIPPIRFKAQTGKLAKVEIPSPTGAAIRSSVSRQPSAYSSSGVDIDAGNRTVELMEESVRATYNASVLAGIGSFGGLFDVSALKQMDHPVLVASTDGVGTKVKLAAAAGRYRGIGHDIVNHCINDILVQGARPLFFMDYFATSKLKPEQTAEVVTGIAEACKESGMALLGGETAEMPGVYLPNEFDIAGTIVGVLERDAILPRPSIRAGDVLIGVSSSGPHTNGYSLIRKIFENTTLDDALADALLTPHRSYFNVLYLHLSMVKALAHITGGGFIENIPRVLPEQLNAVIRRGAWPVSSLWKLIQEKGNISVEEMYRVFNMGIGMIAIVDRSQAADFQACVSEPTFVIGELVDGDRKVILN